MRNIKLVIAYDGTRYDGWQRQVTTGDTIQGKLEALLSRMTEEEIVIHGSGRTDAGVHAYEQVANFHTNSNMSLHDMEAYIRQYLPQDIDVLRMEDVHERFHSRLNVKKKTYVYRIYTGIHKPVFDRRYVYHVTESLDVEAMKKAARHLLGQHDFKSFCTKKKMKKSTVRTIFDISFEENGPLLEITYNGNGFLYHMVRILTGTLIEVGTGIKSPDEIPDILEAKLREKAGFTAPPEGLFLAEVFYE